MAQHDWIPAKEQDQLELMTTWKAGLANPAYKTQFGWVEAECTALITLIEKAQSAHANYVEDNSSSRGITKRRAMKDALAGMRDFARSYIRFNKKMSAEYKAIFGIHEPDREPTPGGEPNTRPNITEIRTLGGCGVEIRFQDEMTPESWAIPEAYNGAVLHYAWGPEKINDIKLLTESKLMTRHIWRLTLPPEAAGAWLSLAACWQSGGDEGRFTEIRHIAVN
ncbi:MAG: hypothetical protein LBS37_06475 [Treponema sp.]|jgi:hypothetical protein|nr:hypothetical protein [Treponema sp.]